MVAISAMLLGYAALAFASVRASGIDADPVASIADIVALDHDSPMFGRPIDDSLYPPVVISNATNSSDGSDAFHASELEYNSDLQRLESFFGQRMERRLQYLPQSSEVSPVPWPSSYWPVYQDGINARWNRGDISAAEKYAKAFNLDPKQFMDAISATNGILSQSRRPQCTSNNDCRSLNDGSVCGKRYGENRGYCIPGWFGICHAWSPAALMEAEPKCPVTVNGVTFRPFDIKALITEVYDGAGVPSVMTGLRYNGPVNAQKDQFGRFVDPAYRDLNPGYFHIAITNLLGRYRRSFVVDVTAGPEVWNQPVRAYSVLRQDQYTPQQAAQTFFNSQSYPFNQYAASIVYVETQFSWVVESGEDGPLVSTGRVDASTESRVLTYLLELDQYGQIIGGEWIGKSKEEHPDFLWFPTQRPDINTVTRVGLSYRNVRQLLDASVNGQC